MISSYIVIFDTSFVSSYLYYYHKNETKRITNHRKKNHKKVLHAIKKINSQKTLLRTRWDSIINSEEIKQKIFNIEDKKARVCTTYFLALEFIDLMPLNDNFKNKCLKLLSRLDNTSKWSDSFNLNILDEDSDIFFDDFIKNTDNIISNTLNELIYQCSKLAQKICKAISSKYKLKSQRIWMHVYAQPYKKAINSELNQINSQILAFKLAWELLLRNRASCKKDQIQELIQLRLSKWYQDIKAQYPRLNLTGTTILLDKLLFKPHKEFADTELIEIASTGYNYKDEQYPAIVFSSDRNLIIERLIKYLKSINKLNKLLNNNEFKLTPGYIVLVPRNENDHSKIEVLDIAKMYDSVRNNSV